MPQLVEILSEVTFYASEIWIWFLYYKHALILATLHLIYDVRCVFVSTRMSKYLSVQIFETATSSHSQDLLNPKGKKIGDQRRPYLTNYLRVSWNTCSCPFCTLFLHIIMRWCHDNFLLFSFCWVKKKYKLLWIFL